MGNVGKDPEFHTFKSGDMIGKIRLATTERWKKDGEKQEKTQWHNVVVKNKHLVEVVERFVQKGTRILLQGKSETRMYKDADGNDKYVTEVVLAPYHGHLQIEARGKGWSDAGGGTATGDMRSSLVEDNRGDPLDEDIPF
jgi:single-strand DNA-binding protein